MILLATIHLDLAGPERLEYLLQKLKPQKITIEWPDNETISDIERKILENRVWTTEAIKKADFIPFVKQYLVDLFSITGYDSLIPIHYAQQIGIPLYPIDHPRIMKELIATHKEATHKEEEFIDALKAGMGQLPDAITSVQYDKQEMVKILDQMYFDSTVFKEIQQHMPNGLTFPADTPEFEEEREQYLADKIGALQPDLHIGGISHVFEGFDQYITTTPLYKLLGSQITQRIKLCDAFKV